MNAYDTARRNHDHKKLGKVRSEIREFNAAAPEFAIKKKNLKSSQKAKERVRSQRSKGVYIQGRKNRPDLANVGRFANIGE